MFMVVVKRAGETWMGKFGLDMLLNLLKRDANAIVELKVTVGQMANAGVTKSSRNVEEKRD